MDLDDADYRIYEHREDGTLYLFKSFMRLTEEEAIEAIQEHGEEGKEYIVLPVYICYGSRSKD